MTAVVRGRPTASLDCFSNSRACSTPDLPVPLEPIKAVISFGLMLISRKRLKLRRMMLVIIAGDFHSAVLACSHYTFERRANPTCNFSGETNLSARLSSSPYRAKLR